MALYAEQLVDEEGDTIEMIVAGLPIGTDVIYRNRQDALNAGNHGINAAGMPVGTEIAERGPVRSTDGDAVFKAALLKVYDTPNGILKSEAPVERKSDHEIAGNRREQEERVTNLIKLAHANRAVWEPFAENQSGVKALNEQVKFGEHGEMFQENGRTLMRISKVA